MGPCRGEGRGGGQRIDGESCNRRGGSLLKGVQNGKGGAELRRNRKFEEPQGRNPHKRWCKALWRKRIGCRTLQGKRRGRHRIQKKQEVYNSVAEKG